MPCSRWEGGAGNQETDEHHCLDDESHVELNRRDCAAGVVAVDPQHEEQDVLDVQDHEENYADPPSQAFAGENRSCQQAQGEGP